MRAKFGTFLMIVGSALVVAALALLLYNEQEDQQAGESVQVLMPQIVQAINQRQEEREEQKVTEPPVAVPAVTEPADREMAVVDIDGYGYIGFVGIPALNLELPVMADWSYPQLKISPCRFTGSLYTDDLVIMAHNYARHFGGLSKLSAGDTVTFTDMNAVTTVYEVVALDVLEPTALEEMTAGEYDLTLFTCTYGGQSRVTIRCDRVPEK